MCVQRTEAGRNRGSDPAVSAVLLTGVAVREYGILSALGPQHHSRSPRIFERTVETVELFPVVMAPQDLATVLLGPIEDRVFVVVVADQNPHAHSATALSERAWLGAGRIRVRSMVAHVGETDVQVADSGIRAVLQREETSRHTAMKDAGWSPLHFPVEDIAVEAGTRLDIIGWEIHEDQSVRFHGFKIATLKGLYGLMV